MLSTDLEKCFLVGHTVRGELHIGRNSRHQRCLEVRHSTWFQHDDGSCIDCSTRFCGDHVGNLDSHPCVGLDIHAQNELFKKEREKMVSMPDIETEE